MKQLQKFISYNNAVPIMFVALFLGGSLTFAQVADVSIPQIVSVQQTVVDTSIIETVDFGLHDFAPTIDSIVESDKTFVVTLGIQDYQVIEGVWSLVRAQELIEIRKQGITSAADLDNKIAGETHDVLEARRTVLRKAKQEAIETISGTSINLAGLLGGVNERPEAANTKDSLAVAKPGFVQGTHRPEDRINPEQSPAMAVISSIIDPIVGLLTTDPDPVVAVVTQEVPTESETESVEVSTETTASSTEEVATSTVTETSTTTEVTATSSPTENATSTETTASSTEEVATSTVTETSTTTEVTATSSPTETSTNTGLSTETHASTTEVVEQEAATSTEETVVEPEETEEESQTEEEVSTSTASST